MGKNVATGMVFSVVILFFCHLEGLSFAKGENIKSSVSKGATENALRSTHSTEAALLDSFRVDFGTIPSATLPLDRWLKHRFSVQNTSSDTMNLSFSVYCKETDQTLPAWPQPNALYLDPGEEQIIITFMDELWGKIRDLPVGQHTRTLEYGFTSKSDTGAVMYTQTYLIDVLDPTQVSGNFLVAGVVNGPDNLPVQGMNVSLSTGNGGYGTNESTGNDGSFSFNVPQRNDWILEVRTTGYAPVCIYVDSSQHNYEITLQSQGLDSTSYVATKLVTTDIGFWRGEVSDDEQYVLITQGMENWPDWSLHDQSKLMMYTIDGQKLWDYTLGQQAWGASLSRDGLYAACVTTAPTGVSSLDPGDISVFAGATGTLLWQKNIETAFGSSVSINRMGSLEVRISSQNQYLAVGTGPGDLLFLDLLTGQLQWRAFLEGQIRNIQFSSDDAFVYAGSGDGRLYKLSTTDGTILWKTHVWAWPFVSGLQLSPDESTIAAGVKTGEVSVVRTSDGARLWTYDMQGTAHWLDYSPDGTYLVVGSGGQGGTTLFDVSTGNPLWTFSFYSASGGFTGDGQYILIHDQPPVILGLNGHLVEMMQPLLAGRAQFSYITKDKSRFVAAARDMAPNGTGITFYEGGIVNYTMAAPSAPVLLSPDSGSTVQELSPILTWRHVNGATSYQLQVATDSTFTNLVLNESSLADTTKQISGLNEGTKYFWKVKAKNVGGTSAFSEVWSFTTFTTGQQPLRPMLVSPANGSTIQELSPTLTWKKEPLATSYQLQVATDSAFTNLVLNESSLADTTKQISGLNEGTKYFWKVKATNNVGASPFSDVWQFTTFAAGQPLQPMLVSPANGSTIQELLPTLIWRKETPATSYQLQVATDSLFANLVLNESSIADTVKQISALNQNTKYFWRVNATNSNGTSGWSTVWQFSTPAGGSAPAAPALSSPTDNTINLPSNPTLVWNASSAATSYRLQVSTNSNFSTTVMNQAGLTATSFQASGLSNSTTYYWRVEATNANGTSPWSTVWQFATITAAPAAPTLASPTDNSVELPTNPTLVWNASGAATSYRLQVSTNSNFSTTVIDQSGLTSTSLQISGLLSSTIHYWRVNATNAGGTSPWSAVWQLTTIVAGPAAPTLFSPADSATGISTSPTLVWNASGEATSYRMQLSTSSDFSTLEVDQSGLTAPSFQVTGLSNSTTHYWRVSASNAGGTSSWSPVWQFMTIVAGPAAPSLSFPGDSATDIETNLTLVWNASSGATNYQLQVSTVSDFSTSVVDQSGITTTSYQVTGLLNGTQYYWRVRAANTGGTSDWSGVRQFTTIVAEPEAPVLSSPADNTTDVSIDTLLVWSAASGATSYRLQVSTTSDFSTTVIDQGGLSAASFQVSGLAHQTSYYWRVNATNAGGTCPWSSVWQFMTKQVTSVETGKELPEEFRLGQNYPNPFNPTTNIAFELPEAEHVVLKVYSVLGEEIATLVSGNLQAGQHSVQFDGSGLASGVYLYKLQTRSFVQIKKMLLVR